MGLLYLLKNETELYAEMEDAVECSTEQPRVGEWTCAWTGTDIGRIGGPLGDDTQIRSPASLSESMLPDGFTMSTHQSHNLEKINVNQHEALKETCTSRT